MKGIDKGRKRSSLCPKKVLSKDGLALPRLGILTKVLRAGFVVLRHMGSQVVLKEQNEVRHSPNFPRKGDYRNPGPQCKRVNPESRTFVN